MRTTNSAACAARNWQRSRAVRSQHDIFQPRWIFPAIANGAIQYRPGWAVRSHQPEAARATPQRPTIMTLFHNILNDQEGETAIEYGLSAALIAVAAITAMGALGNSLSNTFRLVSSGMNNASDGKL